MARRNPVLAIVPLVPACVATWLVLFWTDALLLVMVPLAVALWAAGLGLLTRSPVGTRLGRLGGFVLIGCGLWVAWYTFVLDTSSWRSITYALGIPLAAVLALAGIAVLVGLRRARSPGSG